MKRSLTALCLLLCLASLAEAQDANANANSNANVNASGNVTLVVQPGQGAKVEVVPQTAQPKGLDPLFKDRVDVISKLGTPVSLLVAVILAWQQIKKNREERERNETERGERRKKELEEAKKDREQSERNRLQKEEDVKQRGLELRWRKAQLAKEVLKDLHADPYAVDAMLMLDWNGREFYVKAGRNQQGGDLTEISWPEMWAALRITERHFDDKEKFIRDCFDAFFGHMQTIEHYIDIELIELADVLYPFDYYLYALKRNAFMLDTFVEAYHTRAADFIGRLTKELEKGEGAAAPQDSESSPTQDGEDAPAPPPDGTPTPPGDEAPTTPDDGVPATSEDESAGRAAFFLFDCPPRAERFVFLLEDPRRIAEARAILSDEVELHVSGDIVASPAYYNEPWQFHVEPSSVTFVDAALSFAEEVNNLVEAPYAGTLQLSAREKRAVFERDDIWHTGGARLLAELPSSWFDQEQDGRENERKAVLIAQGRVR